MFKKVKFFMVLFSIAILLTVSHGVAPAMQTSILSFSDLIEDDEV
ncbi:hypothetical protein [Butyrivibrio fibrisolvens]|nr:hypothetical protein [Butyrivibrio fibrisolvens]